MSTRNLIDAILSGDASAVETSLDSSLLPRVADRIDTMRNDVAQNIFRESKANPTVGAGFEDGEIKLGDKYHPTNRIPIEHHAEFKKKFPGSKTFFLGPRKREYGIGGDKASNTTTHKGDATHFKIWTSGSKPSYKLDEAKSPKYYAHMECEDCGHTYKTEAMNPTFNEKGKVKNASFGSDADFCPKCDKSPTIKRVVKEEVEQIDEAKLHPYALHVKPVKTSSGTRYHVHAVGSKLNRGGGMGGIVKGEHLTDSELDDATEMGAKIKHIRGK